LFFHLKWKKDIEKGVRIFYNGYSCIDVKNNRLCFKIFIKDNSTKKEKPITNL